MAKFRQPPYSVAEANIISKSITANGTYNASSDSADGYNPVTVNVPGPVLGPKSISANGTYMASADGYDGFSSVTVSVSGGAQATITVSYDSPFYNKSMTCSDGITTYTETTTNAGSTVFSVNASGTWTVSCNGVTRTVEVVLDYSTQMAITKTITVYSAASDTVSFTDVTGAKTVTTNTSGQGSVSITFIPPSASITFTSSKAKNPSNLSQAYSKTITIDSNTTAIYVMPNGALYWYGNICTWLTGGLDKSLWYLGNSNSYTLNTNDYVFYSATNSQYEPCYFYKNNITCSGYSTVKVIAKDDGFTRAKVGAFASKSNNTMSVKSDTAIGTNYAVHSANVSSYQSAYPNVGTFGDGVTLQMQALWLE